LVGSRTRSVWYSPKLRTTDAQRAVLGALLTVLAAFCLGVTVGGTVARSLVNVSIIS
jgi:hypothetical protein